MTPQCLDTFGRGRVVSLLEDLATRSFNGVRYSTSWEEMSLVIHWLAQFHADFLGDSEKGFGRAEPIGTGDSTGRVGPY